ncbi:FtsX-like permease family protein [Streptomyces melanogenes]|uniref:ABC transporter permease n=1 Tax=Streptomyces melanogenes TaxID=67326 RepID=UPI00379D0351
MMLRYALQTIRDRKGGFLGAFTALMCAAALITACGTLLETGLRGRIATERYAAAPLIVSADQNVHQTTVKEKKGKTKVKHKAKPVAERAWLPDRLLPSVRAVPGVKYAVPELTFLAQPLVKGGAGQATYGHSWESAPLTPFSLVQGHAPRTATEVVIDQGLATRAHLALGDRLTVQSTQSPQTYTVTGTAAPSSGQLKRQTSLFFSAAEAARLAARPGQLSAIGIVPEPGVNVGRLKADIGKALAVAAGGGRGTADGDAPRSAARISTGDARGAVEFLDAAGARTKLVSMGGAIGGTSLLVAVLVVVGTFALSIQQRHRELALLRAIAATPRQVRKLIGREALLVGAVAGVLGSLAGLPLGAWLHGRFVSMGAIPATLERAVSVFPMFAAVAATLLGAWGAARISARRISRIRPAEAMAESAVERARPAWGRVVAGLILLAGGIVLVVVLSGLRTEPASTPVTFLAVVVLASSVSLLGPLLVRGAAVLLAGPLRLAGSGGRLATANLRGNAARMAAAVTPLALLIGMTCTVLFVQPTLGDAARAQAREGLRADWVVVAQGPGVPARAAEKIRTIHGVAATTEIVRATVRVGLDKYAAQGVTPVGLERTWDPDVIRGSLEPLTRDGNAVAISQLAADQLGLRPGSPLKLTLGDGTPATLTVAAVYTRGLGFGDVTLPHDLLAHHMDNPLASTVLVSAASTVTQSELAAAVEEFPGLSVITRSSVDRLQADRQRAGAEVNYLTMGLVLAFTAIAVVNTLAMSVSERFREFAMLRLAGATRRQVLRMLRLEAVAVLLIAAVLGSGISLAVLTAFSVGMTGSAAPAVLPLVYVTVVGVAGLLALVATALPGRMALAVRPVEVATSRQ